MKFTIAISALAAVAAALPGGGPGYDHGQVACPSPNDVTEITNAYADIIGAYKQPVADRWLDDQSFSDWSDSINILIAQPLGGPTFPNKAVFEMLQAKNPPTPLHQTVTAVQCNTIVTTWWTKFGANVPVHGISVLTVVRRGDQWKISKVVTEFNSVAWLIDMGGSCSIPAPPTVAPGAYEA